MPHVVNCIAFYSLDFTNICFKYHERKKPVHTFCTPIFHGILKCDKVCSSIAALHHLLVPVLGPHIYAKCGGLGKEGIPGYLSEPEPRCTRLLSNIFVRFFPLFFPCMRYEVQHCRIWKCRIVMLLSLSQVSITLAFIEKTSRMWNITTPDTVLSL